jgi:hypothetical protein
MAGSIRKREPTRKRISESDLTELKEIRSALLRRFRLNLGKLDKLDDKEDRFEDAQKLTVVTNRLGKSLFECYRIQYNLPEDESSSEGEEERDLALAMERLEKRNAEKKQLMSLKDYEERVGTIRKRQLMVFKDYSDIFTKWQHKDRSTGRRR